MSKSLTDTLEMSVTSTFFIFLESWGLTEQVCELDLIFNFHRAYFILDELIIAGELQETSKKSVLRTIAQQDALEEVEAEEEGFRALLG
jgi:Clathrin adaptor complex small chain